MCEYLCAVAFMAKMNTWWSESYALLLECDEGRSKPDKRWKAKQLRGAYFRQIPACLLLEITVCGACRRRTLKLVLQACHRVFIILLMMDSFLLPALSLRHMRNMNLSSCGGKNGVNEYVNKNNPVCICALKITSMHSWTCVAVRTGNSQDVQNS